jgi:hypothetical protein
MAWFRRPSGIRRLSGTAWRTLLTMRAAKISGILLLTGVIVGGSGQTLPRSSHVSQGEGFVGTWQTNRNKSQAKRRDPDASSVRTIALGENELVVSETYTSGGQIKEYRSRLRCDGTPHPLSVGTVLCIYKDSGLIEGETSSPAGGKSFWTEQVSADGRELRLIEYKSKTRAKLKNLWVYDRVN